VRGVGIHRRATAVPAAALVAVAVLVAACSSGGSAEDDAAASGDDTAAAGDAGEGALPPGYDDYTSATYANDARWLCRPGLADDVCARDLDATAVAADGSTEVIQHAVADDPPVDCFYVYPTTSFDPGPNSDFTPGESEEIATVYNQAARLTSACRVFAPLYRQFTISTIGGGSDDEDDEDDEGGAERTDVAYGDVLDAFKDYVANHSDGRGFVLVGHSQGASMLNRLVREEIDGEPRMRDRLVAAYLLGWALQVPEDDVVGGDFANIPLCEEPQQTGCAVSYASYRSTAPPTAAAFFGRAGDGTRAACVNPADLTGGRATLQPYFLVTQPDGALLGGTSAAQPFADPARTTDITTPWVTYPGLVEAECVTEGDYDYLSLIVNGDPSDPRTDDIGGDLTEMWGMHLVDVNVAMGDIVDLVAAQAAAYVD
jgi:Protein of unknown function (DUF3089)